MAPTWPQTMLVTVAMEVQGEATSIERETFKQAESSMSQGWGGSFEKLDEYLKAKQGA